MNLSKEILALLNSSSVNFDDIEDALGVTVVTVFSMYNVPKEHREVFYKSVESTVKRLTKQVTRVKL